MEQISRIQQMEARMNRAQKNLNQFREMKDSFAELVEDMDALSSYYDSDAWMEDYMADEEHKLPDNLPRGVLSQDGLFNLLTEYDSFLEEVCNQIEHHESD